jgi:hypothetical protein
VTSVDRPAGIILTEAAPMLAFQATNALYEEQPQLWQMGEQGRARTLEDFGHHFHALGTLDATIFTDHVAYCRTLFRNLGFPLKWLDDAWRIMADTLQRELPPEVAEQAVQVLRAGSKVSSPGN